jgi:hypothetical protein
MLLLNVFGELESLISDHLYPYRFVITPVVALVCIGALALAWRRGLHRVLWQHRLATTVVGVPLAVVALIAGNYLLSPLWERSFLEEDSPVASFASGMNYDGPGGGASTQPDAGGAFQPRVVYKGVVMGADDFHFGRGEALIIETAPNSYVLRFESFSVRNGPDLFVYLSEDPSGKRVDESLNLGKLKATDGAFNYEIPAGLDLGKVKTAVVWCRQFSVLFASAELM